MRALFPGAEIIDGDCYVADYTHDTAKKPANERKGVEISRVPFEDIDSFHLRKVGPGNIPYLAVNLEKYENFIKGIDNCECFFHSMSERPGAWLLFLETKYVEKAENIENYPFKAYTQMFETLGKLENLGKVDRKNRRVYFVYSAPEYTAREPFGSFVITQNDFLRTLQDEGIILLGYNSMLIATPYYLFAPKRAV